MIALSSYLKWIHSNVVAWRYCFLNGGRRFAEHVASCHGEKFFPYHRTFAFGMVGFRIEVVDQFVCTNMRLKLKWGLRDRNVRFPRQRLSLMSISVNRWRLD